MDTSDQNSSHAALISNIRERDRAKDVEQFDDIVRTFTSKQQLRTVRKIRDQGEMLAVKKLMLEKLLNFRFDRTTLTSSFTRFPVPTKRQKKVDTSAPTEIGVAERTFGQTRRLATHGLALQAAYKGTDRSNWQPGKGQSLNTRRYTSGWDAKCGGKSSRQRGNVKTGGKGTRKGGKGDNRKCWTCGKTGDIAALRPKGSNKNFRTICDEENEVDGEALDNEEELQAWCLSEEREHEQ